MYIGVFVTMNSIGVQERHRGMSRVSSCLDGVLPFSEAVSVEAAETSDIIVKVQMIRLLLQEFVTVGFVVGVFFEVAGVCKRFQDSCGGFG